MRIRFDVDEAACLYVEAPVDRCHLCGNSLWISDHRSRFVRRLDGLYCLVRQGKWCHQPSCERFHKTVSPHVDLRFALPRLDFGLDVAIEVGERHLRDGHSLRRIQDDLNQRGVAISQRSACRIFRAYVALTKLACGDDNKLKERLRAQGGIVLMADGVQFDGNSPVLYLVWDAISGEPLFGERTTFRSAEDLVPILEKVKLLDVPVIAAVSDKEKGLLPAVAKVFPGVPHQLCQLHFLKNCALAMANDLQQLGQGVARRAECVRKLAKQLHEGGIDSIESEVSRTLPVEVSLPTQDAGDPVGAATVEALEVAESKEGCQDAITEEQLAAEFCAMARHASRATGRAPLNPPEHVRHERLAEVHETVREALKKRHTSDSQVLRTSHKA